MIIGVTGGTGFIGRHLIARHVARGDEVRFLTRNPDRSIAGASAFVANLNGPYEQLRDFLQGVDVLYHCAAELHDEVMMHKTNVTGTANLLEAAQGVVKRWVQLSSTGVYGGSPACNVDESSAVNPENAYEISKAQADDLVLAAASKQVMECVVLRPSNVYGTDMPNQSLIQLIKMINRGWFFFIGEKGAIVNYIYVENVIDALLLAATSKLPANGRIYIVSDHRTLEDFVRIIAAALKKHTPRLRIPEPFVHLIATIFGQLPKFPLTLSRIHALTYKHRYHTARIENELGFKLSVSMEEGITELAQHAIA